jgi:hypothetical protein
MHAVAFCCLVRLPDDERECTMIARTIVGSAFLLALLLGVPGRPCAQSDTADNEWMLDYTALTLAPDGRWGTATDPYFNQAIAGAIANCKAMSGGHLGCGAYLATIRAGWSLGLRCGGHVIVVAERALADAELMADRRERDLRANYAPDMPPCMRVVTVDPRGRIIAPNPDDLSGRVSTR